MSEKIGKKGEYFDSVNSKKKGNIIIYKLLKIQNEDNKNIQKNFFPKWRDKM